MSSRSVSSDNKAAKANLLDLRNESLRQKAAKRSYLVRAPIAEKLRILEEMRDTTRALKQVREMNKAKIRHASTAQLSSST